jgi:hypothetical protein
MGTWHVWETIKQANISNMRISEKEKAIKQLLRTFKSWQRYKHPKVPN